jgi:hypothetical protein
LRVAAPGLFLQLLTTLRKLGLSIVSLKGFFVFLSKRNKNETSHSDIDIMKLSAIIALVSAVVVMASPAAVREPLTPQTSAALIPF